MSKLRVLVLVRKGHEPPETLEGISDDELDAWKAEFDVCETLRRIGHEILPLGVYDDLGPIRKAASGIRAPHYIHDAGRISRRRDL